MAMVPQRHRQTDERTDRQTTLRWHNPAMHIKHRAVIRKTTRVWHTAKCFRAYIDTPNLRHSVRQNFTPVTYVHQTVNIKAQTPLHGHRLRTCCTTSPTDTTNGRAQNNSTTNLPHRNARAHCNIPTCQDSGMWQIFVRWWWLCCTTSCRIVQIRSDNNSLINKCCELVRWWCS